MKKVLLIFMTWWLVIFNNSIMNPTVPTYNFFHLPIPKIFRFLEIITVTVMYFFACIKSKNKTLSRINNLLLAFLFLSLLGIITTFDLSYVYYQIISVYLLISPIIIFVIFATYRITLEEVLKVCKFYFIYVIINAVIAILVNIPLYWSFTPDNVNALFNNAHVFGSYLAVTSVACYYYFLKKKNMLILLISIFFFGVSLFSSNEKIIALNFVVIFVLTLINIKKSNSRIIITLGVTLTLITFTALIYDAESFIKYTGIEFKVFDVLSHINFSEFGFVKAWPMLWDTISKNIWTFFVGVGPANYASAGAQTAFEAGIRNFMYSHFFEEMALSMNAAFQIRFNFFTNLAAEFGIIGFILFFSIIIPIVKSAYNFISHDIMENIIRIIFFFLLADMFLTGVLNAGEWSIQILSYPAMFIGAYLFQKSQGNLVKKYAKNSHYN